MNASFEFFIELVAPRWSKILGRNQVIASSDTVPSRISTKANVA